MKINKLTLHNINAIKGKWTIDFTANAFYQTGIFAILGATGAGKTTLLDTICLAIYGATPRLGKISKTDNALMSIGTGECFAAVELTINGNDYRFEFAQRRAKNKADGTLQEPSHQILTLKNDKFELISEKKSHSEKLAPELLGMDFTQFTRSVLLAQGGFSAFLQSKPEERGEILEKITGTDIYAKIGAKVYQTHSQKLENLTTQKTKLGDMVLLNDEEFKKLESELMLGDDKKNELDKKIIELTHQINQKNQYEKLNLDKEIFINNINKNQNELDNFLPNLTLLNNAKHHHQIRPLFDKVEFLKNQLISLEDENNHLQKTHADFLTKKSTIEQNITSKTSYLNQYQIFEKLLTDNPLFELSLSHQNHTKNLIESIHQLKSQQLLIEELRKKENTIHDEINVLSTQFNQDKHTYQTLTQTLSQTLGNFISKNSENEIENFHHAISNIHHQERQLQQKQLTIHNFIEKWKNLNKNSEQLRELNKNLTHLQNTITHQQATLKQCENQKHAAQTLLESTEQTYRLSSELMRLSDFIQHLTDGTPCPLCGSENHPYAHTPPHRSHEHQLLWEQLQTHQQNFKTAQSDHDTQKSQLDSLVHQFNQDKLRLSELQNHSDHQKSQLLGEWQDLSADLTFVSNQAQLLAFEQLNDAYLLELKEKLANNQDELSHLHNQSLNSLQELQTLSQSIHFYQKNLDKLQQTLSENQHNLNQEKFNWKQKQSLPFDNFLHVKTIQNQMAEFYQTFMPSILAITQSQTTFEFDGCFNAYQQIENIYQTGINKESLGQLYQIGNELTSHFERIIHTFNDLKEITKTALQEYQFKKTEQTELIHHLSNLNTQLTNMDEQMTHIHHKKQLIAQEVTQKEQEFLTQLREYFQDIEEFLSAQLSQEKYEELESFYHELNHQKRHYELQLETTNTQLKQLLLDNPAIDKENDEQLHEELAHFSQEKETLLTTLGAISNQFDIAKHNKTLANDLMAEIQKTEQELSNWTLLNALIGSADGKKYRNFAQSLTLSALLDEANVILEKMSDRYILTTASDPKNLLGIELIDTHQGDVIRQSKNLSGGESFLVSLSLALGLSAMSSQNRQIDSLFLDEGFGTLDEEALDIALTALSEIQASGKMIGIISHIGALKERIGTQILVQKQGEGVSILSGMGVERVESP